MNYIQQLGQNAARAKKQIAGCPTGEKNRILTEIAAILRANASEILKALHRQRTMEYPIR